MASGATGTQTAGYVYGGVTTANLAITEMYDGTSWSTGPNLAEANRLGGGCGTQSAALLSAGEAPGDTLRSTSYEFTGETTSLNLKTITDS